MSLVIDRVIAVCSGGLLDGLRYSVVADQDRLSAMDELNPVDYYQKGAALVLDDVANAAQRAKLYPDQSIIGANTFNYVAG